MKIGFQLFRAGPNFDMTNDNPNVGLGIVDCSLYTRCIALRDDYQKKRMDMVAFISAEFNCLETPAKAFLIPSRQN